MFYCTSSRIPATPKGLQPFSTVLAVDNSYSHLGENHMEILVYVGSCRMLSRNSNFIILLDCFWHLFRFLLSQVIVGDLNR